jgi:fluoride exporter
MGLTAIIVGSAMGGVARFWLSEFAAARLGERFPWGTLLVNVSGAMAIGLLVGFLPGGLGEGLPGGARQLAGLGFLGSYTTVSSFSLQTLALAHDRQWRRVLANIGVSFGGCLAAAALGLAAGAWASGALA